MQKLLMVEDNPADIALWRFALDRTGDAYELQILPDGEAALNFVQQQRTSLPEPEPCVILLDLHLPKHSGIEVLQAIKNEPVLAHIQVVVLTSMASPADLKEIEDLGAVCRHKPAGLRDFEDLAAEVIEICKGSLSLSA